MAMQRSSLSIVIRMVSICVFCGAILGGFAFALAHAQEPPPPDAALAPAGPDAITFTAAVNPIVANGVGNSDVAWGDYDNDGYLDLLLSGCLPNASLCNVAFHRVYHNNAGANFSLTYTLPETGGTTGHAAWGDYDNDGDLDILLAGWSNGANALQVFQNTGSGFTLFQTFEQTNAYSLAWGDYDNDGRLDILMGGRVHTAPGIWVYRNTGIGFTQAVTVTIGDATYDVAWGDYDNDGFLDVLSTAEDYPTGGAGVYRNNGIDFTRTYTLPGWFGASAAWGDYDNDGRLDILFSGQEPAAPRALVLRNTGATFTTVYDLVGLAQGSAAWGDYDSDGRLDILLTGMDDIYVAGVKLYRNTGSGFSATSYGLTGAVNGDAAWGDYNNDGRLDIALTGCIDTNCTNPVSKIYQNNGATPNTLPTAPTNLRSSFNGSQVTLQWSAATDGATPAAGLNYNLYLTPTTGSPFLVSPMANTVTGYRRLPALGNAQQRLVYTAPLTAEGGYAWSVQAVDTAWAGGAWAATSSFQIGCVKNTNDSGPGSLRQTTADAEAGATICFDPSLSGKTIALASAIQLNKSVTISGTVPITISGSNATRVFEVGVRSTVSLYGLTIRNGAAPKLSGGGISNMGTLKIERCTILYNIADYGGGIYSNGELTIDQSAILSNTAREGGAIHAGGPLTVRNSTLAHNRATHDVTGVLEAVGSSIRLAAQFSFASVCLLAVIWPANRRRARLYLRAAAFLLGAAILPTACFSTDNTAAGGAIYFVPNKAIRTFTLSFNTFAHNSAENGGGAIYYAGLSEDSHLIGNVISQNIASGSGNCSGKPLTSQGGNVSSDNSCGFAQADDRNNMGAQVGSIQPNGTVPLLPTSIAIGNVTANCPAADQLGQPRTTPCDAGALIFNGAPNAQLQVILRATRDRANQGQTLTFSTTVLNSGPVNATNVTVRLALPAGLAYAGTPTWSGGTCAWSAPNLTCSSALPRVNQLMLYVPAQVTTQDIGALAVVAGASASGMAAPVTGGFQLMTQSSAAGFSCDVGAGWPYATIQSAVEATAPGGAIKVCDGTYYESIQISKSITITGMYGANFTIVDGNRQGRVFDVARGATVNLVGLTIRNGNTGDYYEFGGGVRNFGILTVSRSILTGNTAGRGGGIFNGGVLIVNQSSFYGNNGLSLAGAIENSSSATLAVTDSVFSGNSADGAGGGIHNYGSARIMRSTFSNNRAFTAGGAIANEQNSLVVENSILSDNTARSGNGAINTYRGAITITNSVLQPGTPVGAGGNNRFADPLFVRNPGNHGSTDFGDLHLWTSSPAIGLPTTCAGFDRDGTERRRPCAAGAYELTTAQVIGTAGTTQDTNSMAARVVTTFTNTQGIVKLDIPTGAVTQTVQLAFSLGQVTGGDGRLQSVVFTPYDAAGQPLPANFGFQQPLVVTLGYDPVLVTQGQETNLLPMRFEPDAGTWLPFTGVVAVDKVNRTVTFSILQTGEYGLFAGAPTAYAAIGAVTPHGIQNLGSGVLVTYTLVAINGNQTPLTSLVMNHTVPAGITFVDWVQANGATRNGNNITWNIDTLAGGGMRAASFSASVSSDPLFWGKPVTSTVTLAGPGGLNTGGEAGISVNGPTTPVTDSVTTRPNTPVSLWPLANDINPDRSPLVIAAAGTPAHGIATIAGDTVTYTPSSGFEGEDAFPYTVQDGQFTAYGIIRVQVAKLAHLSVNKTLTSGTWRGQDLPDVPQGSIVTYELSLLNGADGEIASNAVLTDVIPAGVQFTQWITQSGATLNGSTIQWNVSTLPKNTVATISFRAMVTAAPGSVIPNTARATAANALPSLATATITVGNSFKVVMPQVLK